MRRVKMRCGWMHWRSCEGEIWDVPNSAVERIDGIKIGGEVGRGHERKRESSVCCNSNIKGAFSVGSHTLPSYLL